MNLYEFIFNIDRISIIFGTLSVLVLLIYRVHFLGINRDILISSLGYAILSYPTAIMFVKTIHLMYLTFINELDVNIIMQNKLYIYPAWLVLALASVVSYYSLLTEHKNIKSTTTATTDSNKIKISTITGSTKSYTVKGGDFNG